MSAGSLEALARDVGGRVEACDYRNPNVGERAAHRLRARLRGYRVSVFLSKTRIEFSLKGIDTRVSLSVNHPDRVCLLKTPLDNPPAGLSAPVFVGSSPSRATLAWLSDGGNVSCLSDWRLTPRESLQVYRNAVVLIGEHQRASLETVERLCALADRLRAPVLVGTIDGLRFSPEKIPPGLRPLEPWVRRLAVADDDQRANLVAGASRAERERLREQFEPLLPQINEFLDSFGDRPLSEEAILLGNLAEAVAELGAPED